ncbi:hypothetical protein PHYPSEUDO_008342 [Phytophthora pseudosyringae]|uniref:ALMS motif domain-containing protein n=1 Tax=Phytophthora pseudosyringae TaxID=221518 RepID=A0A8T1VEP2_9STRA|nr:hypothetical protein PHYPSEUDO_008342 [Phytophthora pseudosyringae]
MAAPRAPRGRRRRDASLGQIPLSSGEIELYSRQDEAARRRRRLLAVREQERRLAQQVTQRYRDNLQKLRHRKRKTTRSELSAEQQKMLTELHVRYQNSLQSMGTAQRNARLKLLELMEQAHEEKSKWAYNRQVTGKQRAVEAQGAQEEEEQRRTARRRQVEQNMERLRVLSGQQRQEASARAGREQELAAQRAKDREEIERLRRTQSPEEVFVTPRPHEKDVRSYQFTRTHCLAPTPAVERPAVTVIRHNRKHPTAARGEEEAKKYRDELDVKRERGRVIADEQEETAAERGKSALEDVTSRQQGKQALEWLALVDKMERRARGQEMGGAEDYPLGEVDGEIDDPERVAERAFARMLGLDEDSVELSAFSIETDDDQSVGLADTDHENSDGVKVTDADVDYRVKLKAAKHNNYFGPLDGIEARRPGSGRKNDQAEVAPGKPVKATTFGDLQREEFRKLKKAKDAREKSAPSEGVELSLKPRAGEYEDMLRKPGKNPLDNDGGHGGTIPTEEQHLQWDSRTMGASTAAADDRGRLRYEEEGPECTDSEEDEVGDASDRLSRDDGSIERLENRLQEVLDLRLSRPREDRPFEAQHPEDEKRAFLSSGSEAGQRLSQLDEVAARDSQRDRVSRATRGLSYASDGSGNASVNSAPGAIADSDRFSLSLAATPGFAAPGGHHITSAVDEKSVAHDDGLSPSGHRHGSSVTTSIERGDMYHDRRTSKGASSRIYHGRDPKARLRDDRAGISPPEYNGQPDIAGDNRRGSATRLRDDSAGVPPPKYNGQSDIAGDYRIGSSDASSGSSCRSGYFGEEHGYDEAGPEERGSRLAGFGGHDEFGDHDAVAPHSKEVSAALDRNEFDKKASLGSRGHEEERLSRQSAHENHSDLSGSRHFSDARHVQGLADEHEEHLSSNSIASSNEEFHDDTSAHAGKISRVVTINEDQRSVSESSFAPSQKSLSRLDQVANARGKSLEQRFIDQHMASFSSSDGLSEDEEADTDPHRPSTGNNDGHPSANINPSDPYRQQIGHQARRSSTSAVSVAQYSLPPSDTQSSFDDSFDQLHPGYGDDSFVNELVPMFPKRALPPPPQSLEEDSQTLEEYDVQLVAPNMSRMLTSERRTSFGRSRQHPIRFEPQSGSTERSHRQSASATARRAEGNHGRIRVGERSFSASSGRSSSSSSNSEMDAKSIDTSNEQSEPRQQPVVKQTRPVPTIATEPGIRQLHGSSRANTVEHHEIDAQSHMSSESGISSLGFAVQLNLAAGTTRRRNNGDDRREVPNRGDRHLGKRTGANVSDDELDSQSIASERSFGSSSSSMSMDAHFNYLANMTSAVGKSLPLHLRIPAIIYGTKDMTKPPAPMAWSASSVSSIASASEADHDEASERESHSARRSIPRSNSSMSESLLEEQHVPPPPVRHKLNQPERDSDSQNPGGSPPGNDWSKGSDTSSDSESAVNDGGKRAARLTLDNIKEKVSQLPPPPLGSLDLSQPPPPVQNFGRHLAESQSSFEKRSSERHHLPPPPLGSHRMSQPPPPMQTFRHDLDDSQSSSELSFGDAGRDSNCHPYRVEEERKQGDSSSESGAISHSEASFSSSSASSRRQRAAKIVIPVKASRDSNNNDSDGDQEGTEVSLAEAFRRRHPGFGRRVESHRDKLKRQRDKQQQTEQSPAPLTPRGRSAADDLAPEQQEVLKRLASGNRAKISSREMKERSRRLYHQLPEVVERKRQEEVMRRRRERLDELREQEKERRLQQKQRRLQRR